MAYKPQVLELAAGGTNAALTASNGGIFYSTASAGALLAGTSTASQALLSGSSTTPAWSTATYPATTTANQLLYSSATNTIGGLTSGNNGVLITSGAGVPSISSTLPSAVQGNITSTGNLGNQTNTTRSAFLAYASANKSNVTGDGTTYTVLFDTASFDQASNYNTGTGIFTAPVTGKYQFNWMMYLSGLTVSDTSVNCYLLATSQQVTSIYGNVGNLQESVYLHSGSAFISMAANDTAEIQVIVSGSTKTINVVGGVLTTAPSYFSGYLVC